MICQRCIYDDTVPHFSVDSEGICHYCRQIESLDQQYPQGEAGEACLNRVIESIKQEGRGKKYDAVIGVSGGCDSSYLVHRMHEAGLRLLAVHFDNTWNSTVATENIHNVLRALNIDLFTIVMDNREHEDMVRAFLASGVKDIEAPTDIGLATTLYRAAEKFGVRTMIEGHSFRTEGVAPLGWCYMDGRYIAKVHQRFGTLPMKTFPNLWFKDFLRWMVFGRYKKIRPLYWMNYDKEEAKRLLQERYGWQWYGGHHLENRFTAFFHSYFLPKRWGIDFRMAGFSAYCRNGWMSREEALEKMKESPYLEEGLLEYVKSRLNLSEDTFEHLMTLPKKTYHDYPTYKPWFEKMRPFFWLMTRLDRVPQSFYMKYCKSCPPA